MRFVSKESMKNRGFLWGINAFVGYEVDYFIKKRARTSPALSILIFKLFIYTAKLITLKTATTQIAGDTP